MGKHLRRGAMILTGICLLSYLSDVGAMPDKKAADPRKGPNFYPVEVGNTWHYKFTANGTEVNVVSKIAKHEKIDDVILARLDIVGGSSTEHLMQNDKGVFRYRHNGADVTPPAQLLPYPPKVGTKWQGESTVLCNKVKYDGEIQAEETVDVPAGKYKTLKVQINVVGKDGKVTTVYWFANNVGFVKQTVTDGAKVNDTIELEKFERKK